MIIGLVFNELLCSANHSYSYTILVMTFSYFLVFAYGVFIKNIPNKQILTIGGGYGDNIYSYGHHDVA